GLAGRGACLTRAPRTPHASPRSSTRSRFAVLQTAKSAHMKPVAGLTAASTVKSARDRGAGHGCGAHAERRGRCDAGSESARLRRPGRDKAVVRPEILEHLRKDPPYLVLSRIRSGRDLGAIVGSAHFSYQYHADPEDEQEADLIAGIVQEVHDWSDTWSDIEPGDHVRIQYRLGEAIKEIEAAGWSVFAGKRSGRREFGG